jgi:hypothetical protein
MSCNDVHWVVTSYLLSGVVALADVMSAAICHGTQMSPGSANSTSVGPVKNRSSAAVSQHREGASERERSQNDPRLAGAGPKPSWSAKRGPSLLMPADFHASKH